jgi:hypothetical protein
MQGPTISGIGEGEGRTYVNASDRVDIATQEEKVNDNIGELRSALVIDSASSWSEYGA